MKGINAFIFSILFILAKSLHFEVGGEERCFIDEFFSENVTNK